MTKSNLTTNKLFKTSSIQLAAALLTRVPEVTFTGFEDDPIDIKKKIMLISYPVFAGVEVDKILNEFDNKVLSVNLFYYNRNLNFLRDRLFSRKPERRDG